MMHPFAGNGQTGQPSSPVAEVITPDIQALARGLQNNPVQIFNYVHDHIRFELYFGSKKGAEITLLEKSGNDFDQCALLVALLRAAGYSPEYEFGLADAPYDATDGSDNDWQHWLQASLVNTNWGDTTYFFPYLIGTRGYPTWYSDPYDDENSFGLQHVWVTLTIGGTNYLLDPSFKVSEPVAGISLTNAMGFSASSLLSAAGGTDTANYATNLNESSLRAALTGYTTNLFNYLQSNMPNATVQQVLGGWQIVPSTNTTLPQSLPFDVDSYDLPVEDWTYEPTNLMTSFSISFAGTNYFWWIPQLEGQRISLTYSNNGVAQLWQDDTLLLQKSTTTSQTNYILSINHPFGTWDFTNNVLIDDGLDDQSVTDVCQRTSSTYVFPYAFNPDWGWLHERQNKLDAYRLSGLSNTSQQVTEETLNIFGLTWVLELTDINRILASEMGMLPENLHTLGRTAQETGGFFIDIYNKSGDFPATGYADPVSQDDSVREPDLVNYFGSSLESGVIQQLGPTNLAASTVRMLEIAATNHQAVFLATSTNWTAIQGHLTGYDANTEAMLEGYADSGYYVLLPQNGSVYLSGSAGWHGYGAVTRYYNPTYMYEDMEMLISGVYNGGYSDGSEDADDIDIFDDSFWDFFDLTPILTPYTSGADPVDMADGTFQVENTDLSLGQDEPRGIKLTRYYNGVRRNTNPVGMAGGWIHSYYFNAVPVAAPWPALGEESPQHMVAMLAATSAAANFYSSTPDAENWLATALVAKWGTDQLNSNAVSVTMGKDTVEFIKQPNGTYTPPPNCNMTLIQTNASYYLQMRHGNTFKFNSLGLLTNIVDQYGNGMKFTYNASNWVQTITDWTNRTLTFTYSGTPVRLASVSDGTRTVKYGYSTTYNSEGDLTSFTDAQGNTNGYIYDTNHDITESIDGQGRLVVSNLYDSLDHIATQSTEGNPNKTWQIFWSGWQTIEQDPVGSQRIFSFDDQTRLTSVHDQLGHVTQIAYDGQNHITTVVSPLNETNEYIYDGNNNILESIDALGFTNQYVYDSNNNLIEKIDPRANPTTYGYNAQFSLIGQTNGAGDYINYSYNPNGTLASRTDSGGTTTYGYDTFGQLKSIIYPNSLGTNTFGNSFLGDVTNEIDGRGFATILQYNARRQLTNTIEPTNLITKIAYDPEGNRASVTDARGNIISESWSATGHLLSTILPAIPQGTPVTTNIYDNREWLTETLDPLQNPTTYAYDAAKNLVAQTDPLSRTTTFAYDADNRKVATTNAASEVTAQTWDAKGELIDLIDGAGHISVRGYDGAGNQTYLINRNTNTWHFYFDNANRLTNTVSPLGRSTTVVFNHQSLPILVSDPMQQITTNGYDAKGRLTNRADNVASTLYTYDANDNRTAVVENGLTNLWTYDAYNRISSYTDVYGNLIQYRYDANGNLTNLVYPGGKNVYYAYDSDNHMTNVTDWSGRKTTITRDLDGRVTGIYRPNGTYRTIGYDSAGEITNILEQMANGLPIALMRYNWDLAARMSLDFVAPLPHTNSPPTRYMSYDADNKLVKVDSSYVTMDYDGNLLSGPLTNDTFETYTYDARNRLLNVGGVTNIYDAANNRIGQFYGTNSVLYVVNPNAKLPQVLMRTKNGVTTYYVYGAGLLYQVTETPTGTNTVTYHYDGRGSTIALTGDNGLVTDRMEYSLYATLTYHAGTNDTPFLFNGQYGVLSDPNGLIYMRARYYNPFLCRFLNPDPSQFKGGMNFYSAFNGNPASYLDPSGLGAQNNNYEDNSFESWISNPDNFSISYDQNANQNTPSTGLSLGGSDSNGSVDFTAWLNNNSTLDLYNNSPDTSYETISATLNVAGIAQFGGEFGSGAASIGINNASGELSLYSHFYGNQYSDAIMFSDIFHFVGYPLAVASVYSDYNVYGPSSGQFWANTSAVGIGLFGGPVGASFGVGYGGGTVIQAPVNNAVEATFQIFTDMYYGNYDVDSPNFPEPIVMPPPN